MQALFWLAGGLGLLPLVIGAAWLRAPRGPRACPPGVLAGSSLLCALSYNLTFLWQEFGLVIAKAATPGLHPVLHHNDHGWSGESPFTELLQGAGALATLSTGLGALALMRMTRNASMTWRLFAFWMAFQGLNQSLSQLAIGSLLAGNDVGRAMTYLGIGHAGRVGVLIATVVLLAGVGAVLARRLPVQTSDEDTRRAAVTQVTWPAALSVLLVLPFRVPREVVEVAFVPALSTLIGTGWVVLGMVAGRSCPVRSSAKPAVLLPALALAALLVFFQLVLRPGVAF